MQILPTTPNFGQSLGASLGSGLSAGLQALAAAKLDQVHRFNREKSLAATFGPELAKTLSSLNPQEFGQALRYLGQQDSGQQQIGQPAYDQSQADYLLGQPQQPQQVQQPAAKQVRPQMQNVVAQQAPALSRPTAQPQVQAAAQKQATMQQLAGQVAPQIPTGTSGIKITPDNIIQQGPQNVAKVGMVAPVKKAAPLTVQDVQQLRQQPITAPIVAQNEQNRAAPSLKTIQMGNKENKDYLDDLSKRASTAKQNNQILDRMLKISNSGKLMNRFVAGTLDTIGLEKIRKSISNKETAEYEKLGNQFIRGAKAIFGSRPTQFDIQKLLDTIPNLYQSPEGVAEIVRDSKILNEYIELEQKAARDIIKENGGVPPFGLQDKVNQRTEVAFENLGKKLIEGAPEPEFQLGKIYKNKNTGKRAKWNGREMVEIGKDE
jgi:hypothetical protein